MEENENIDTEKENHQHPRETGKPFRQDGHACDCGFSLCGRSEICKRAVNMSVSNITSDFVLMDIRIKAITIHVFPQQWTNMPN